MSLRINDIAPNFKAQTTVGVKLIFMSGWEGNGAFFSLTQKISLQFVLQNLDIWLVWRMNFLSVIARS